jgi:hypothetical protein
MHSPQGRVLIDVAFFNTTIPALGKYLIIDIQGRLPATNTDVVLKK